MKIVCTKFCSNQARKSVLPTRLGSMQFLHHTFYFIYHGRCRCLLYVCNERAHIRFAFLCKVVVNLSLLAQHIVNLSLVKQEQRSQQCYTIDLYHMLSQTLLHTEKLEKSLFLAFEIESDLQCVPLAIIIIRISSE